MNVRTIRRPLPNMGHRGKHQQGQEDCSSINEDWVHVGDSCPVQSVQDNGVRVFKDGGELKC